MKTKKISPWYMYLSKLGLKKLNSLDEDELQIFESAIKVHVWIELFENNDSAVNELKSFFNEPDNIF
jgi:hypothetical protein